MTEGAIIFLAKLGITKGRTTPARDNIESYNIDELIDLVASHPCFQEIYMPIIQAKLDDGRKMLKANTVHSREANSHLQKPGFYITSSKLISNIAEPFYKKGPRDLYKWWTTLLSYMKQYGLNSINDIPINAGTPITNFNKPVAIDWQWTFADIIRYVIVNCITHILNSYIKYGVKDKIALRKQAVANLELPPNNKLYYDRSKLERAYKRETREKYKFDTREYPAHITNKGLYAKELHAVKSFLDTAYTLITDSAVGKGLYKDILNIVMTYSNWDDERMSDQIIIYSFVTTGISYPRVSGVHRVNDFINRLNGIDRDDTYKNVFVYLPMTTAPDYRKTIYLYSIPVIFFSIVNEVGHGVTFTSKSNIYHDVRHKQKYIYMMRYLPTLKSSVISYNTGHVNKYSPIFSIARTKRSMSRLKSVTPHATKFESLIQRAFSTVGTGLQSHASGTAIPLNSRPAGVGLELSVDGTAGNDKNMRKVVKQNNSMQISTNKRGPTDRNSGLFHKISGLDLTKFYEVQKFIYYLCYISMDKIDTLDAPAEFKEDLYYIIFTFVHENELLFFLNRTLDPDIYNSEITDKYKYFAEQMKIVFNKVPGIKANIISQFLECQKIGISYLLYGARIIKIFMDPEFRKVIRTACNETNKRYGDVEWPAGHMLGNGAHPRFFEMDYYFKLIDTLTEIFDTCGFYIEELDTLINYYDISKYEHDAIFGGRDMKGMVSNSRFSTKKSRASRTPK